MAFLKFVVDEAIYRSVYSLYSTMNTREKILQVALELFYREGYESSGVQKIVELSGVQKPTLYHYFGSKRGLLETLINDGFDEFWPQLVTAAQYESDITANLERIFCLYFSFAKKHPIFYQWYLSIIQSPLESDSGKLIAPVLERQCVSFAKLFELAAEDHGNMKGRNLRYAFTYLGMINTCITTAFYNQLELSDENAHIACKQFMHGIFS
ncbi:MAG: TetR/AcrR family transcriptional regulator [Opitutales bacterium]|nr:TetR/AcrR family transcriptional regulator [Opitutales bacterium]